MKLTSKYRQYTVTTLVCVVLASFTIQYFLFRYSIHRTTDDVLNEYRADIESYAAQHDTLQSFQSLELKHSNLEVKTSPYGLEDIDQTIYDTLIFSQYEREMVVYRKMVFPVSTSTRHYVVTIMLPTLEEDDLVGTVILSLCIIVLLFILFSTITDWAFSRSISRPLHKILQSIRSYNIEQPSTIRLENYGIDEFRELNNILKVMMDKINRDYGNMKDFLENTSHELQTPLSIIQLKMETLSQCCVHNEECLKNIASINNAISRISKFNRSLLFLAKINNNQFAQKEELDLNDFIGQFLNLYKEVLDIRNIGLSYIREGSFRVSIHPTLAEQLIQNILTNATKHNYDDGRIEIHSSSSGIMVSNTFHGELPSGCLFEKYKYTPSKSDSTGLGLTIAKNICDKNNLDISYRVEGERFIILVGHSI